MKIQHNISLKLFNTFHVEAFAEYFVNVTKDEELLAIAKDPKLQNLHKLVLGGGSNLLLTKDFKGLVIRLRIKGINVTQETKDHIWLSVAAGEQWNTFINYCIKHQYTGVENLFLIPGTVGAAVVQNTGAYGMEISDSLVSVETINLDTGEIKQFSKNQCQFQYRSSRFKVKDNSFVVTRATFKLSKHPIFKIDYQPLKKLLPQKKLTLQDITKAIVNIRKSKLPDYQKFGNAGSFFKNPIVSLTEFNKLFKDHPNIPHWKYNDHVKLAAAWLIEQCGYKGKRVGDTGVYDKHALVLINYGKASGLEIKQFADQIIKTVFNKFNVRLEPEVVIF